MKNKDKYYTPSLEEFCIGFRCEIRLPILTGYHNETNGSKWNKNYVVTNFQHIPFNQEIINSNYRTKFLDTQDIEELGFEKYEYKNESGLTNVYWDFYKKDNFYLSYPKNDITKICIDNGESYEDNVTYFDGTVKNYNELEKVCKMIGVI